MQYLALGIYIGGLAATAPMALVTLRHGFAAAAVGWLGWPVMLLGIAAGLVRFKGGVAEG